MFKNSVITAQDTRRDSVTNTDWLVLLKKYSSFNNFLDVCFIENQPPKKSAFSFGKKKQKLK
jgi:hypothetical protein